MEEQKLVLQDGTYKYDDRTRQVSVSEEQLKKAGYVKLADDEQIVKKAVLSKEEAEWFEKHKDLPYFDGDSDDYFSQKVFDKMMEYREGFEDWEDFKDWKNPNDFHNRLSQAYFTGYTIEKEKKYYIKSNFYTSGNYLNTYKGRWYWNDRYYLDGFQTWFTQEEINQMQKDPQAKGLDLNALKVEVPEDRLVEG
ncbi:DUF1642 domain-containing protein [uncultured Lactobacillus sp.]|uniref:DUF1642 domain-containing protein n=1 Tax=uncultured Lactobacillus sp. TaxID=153152 RepID=UPI0026125E74|nr:DUF1642 domain-containing protein [uncultured Lactobacillus sp.]